MKDLPESWSRVEITEVLEANNNGKPFQQGWSPRCENFPAPEGKWGVLKTTSIQYSKFWDHENKFLPDHLEPRPHLEVKLGDVLMTCAGPRARCGVACLVERTRSKLMMSGKIYRFRPYPEAMHPKYLSYMIQTAETQREIDQMKTGINDSGLNLTHSRFAALKVVVAPLNEQRRIVAKIEELFSELDKGIESLKTARAKLNVYRQAVLKHAFEGKLTAQWRKENKDNLETPEQLLARIKQEREARYEQQLQEWKTAVKEWEESGKSGKKPSKPRKTANLILLGSDALAKLPPLPEGYAYTYLANLGELGRGKSKHRPRNAPELFGGPYPFIQTGEVKAAGRIIREYSQTYSELGLEQSKLWPEGTLCITIAANIAETAFLGFDGCFPDSIVGFTAAKTLVLPEYVELFIKSVRTRIEAYAPATAQKNINLTTLENLVVPLCSLEEQRVLVNQLEVILSVIDDQRVAIDNQLLKVDALRQSILKKAFNGQLVAQDPHDEPTSGLLDRIRAEREKAMKNNHSKKTKKRKTTV